MPTPTPVASMKPHTSAPTFRSAAALCALLALALILVIAGPRGDGTVSTAAAGDAEALASGKAKKARRGIHTCANRERKKRGVDKLKRARPLSKAAQLHARNMARKGFFEHTDHRGEGPRERVNRFDKRYSFVGENIAAGYSDPKSTCRGWMKSDGHRANILNPDYDQLGTGFVKGGEFGTYWVQVFAAKP